MNLNIVSTIKVTKPDDCILACCYPLTKQDFFVALDRKQDKDFVSSQFGVYSSLTKESLWNDVYKMFAHEINEGLNEIERYGVHVIRNFTLDQIEQMKDFRVFTIFAHNSKTHSCVELFDGMVSNEVFANRIPKSFTGIFDLTACNSTLMRNELKKQFYHNQVISFRVEIRIIALMFHLSTACS